MTTMVQDHRNDQDFSLAAGSRATGAPATQRCAGPGPCGPVPDLPRPQTEGYIIVNGRRENISNPQYGVGPSKKPCPGNCYVWKYDSWHRVHPLQTYAAAVTAGHTGPAPAPACTTRTASIARATNANAALDLPATPAVARTLLALAAPSSHNTNTGPRRAHNARRAYHEGYQMLVFGVQRGRTTLTQVTLAGKDVLQRVRQRLPLNVFGGRGVWVGQHAALFDLGAEEVKRLTAGSVHTIKYNIKLNMRWRVVFLYEGNVILSAPEAYRALDSNPRERMLYFTTELSNQFAALEPDAEWYQDVALDTFESDDEEPEGSECCSDGPELEEAQEEAPAQLNTANTTQRRNRRRRHRRSRAPVQPSRGFNLGVLNVTGLPKEHTDSRKLLEIQELMLQYNLDVFGISETHEDGQQRHKMDLMPGYKYYSKPRVGGRGGGVGAFVHESLANEVKPFACTHQQYAEALWLVMQKRGAARKMFIGVVYMPDMGKSAAVRQAAYEQVQQDLLHLSSKGSVVVMGDFNARVGRAAQPTSHIGMHGESNDDANGNGQLLLSLLSTVNMYALNARTPPPTADAHLTYVKRRSASGEVMGKSLIDYVIASPDIAMPSGATAGPTAFVGECIVSTDHLPVITSISRPVHRRGAPVIKLRLNANPKDFRKQHGEVSPALETYHTALCGLEPAFTALISALEQQHAASQVSAATAVKQAHDTLVSLIKQAVTASFGYKQVLVGKSFPWWTQQLSDAIRDKTQAFNTYKASGLARDWQTYLERRKEVKMLITAAKQKHREQRSAAITEAYNDRLNDDSVLGERDMWLQIRALCPKHVVHNVFHAIKHPNGSTATCPAEIADAFKCHYEKLGSQHAFFANNPQFDNDNILAVHCDVQMHLLESHSQENNDAASALNSPIAAAEITQALKRMKTNKAGNPAEQGIVNELLKYGGGAMRDMLLSYCNLMWQLEQVHQVPGTIINLPKQGDLSDPTNYRGITLLSVLYKLYTSVLNRRLISFAEGGASQQQQQTPRQQQQQEEQEQATHTEQPQQQPQQQQQQQQTENQPLLQPACQLPQQQQSIITWRQAVTRILSGQLQAANFPRIVPACVRPTNESAVTLARACQRALAAVTRVCKKLNKQPAAPAQQQQQQHPQCNQPQQQQQQQPAAPARQQQHPQRSQAQQQPAAPAHQQQQQQHPHRSQPQQQRQQQQAFPAHQQQQQQEPLLHESQNGFRPQRSCADHQFVLNQILTGRKLEKKDTYVLFVDTYKAFPTVWLDGLFHKLWEKGVNGKMFRVLYNLYQGANRVVSHDGCVTDAFSSDLGLHEGDVISPTLYLFFINDLLCEVWNKHPGVTLLGPSEDSSNKAVAAMQADDFVAVCSSLAEAQAVAQTVYDYSIKWCFRLNSKKSALMHVAPNGVSDLVESGIVWNGVHVPVVSKYRYLGLLFENNCSWNAHLEEVLKKVEQRKNMFMPLWKNRHIKVEVKRIVLLTCVRPIIEFGAEVWAPTTANQWNKIDRVQTDIIKCAMRIAKENPCSRAVLAEWGVKPMHMWLHERALGFYFRVRRLPDCRLPKQVLNAQWLAADGSVCVLPWQKYVNGLLFKYGINIDVAASSTAEQCKKLIKQQVAAKYADMVVNDMASLSTLKRYVDFVNPGHVNNMSFKRPRPYLRAVTPSLGIELMMRVRLGCLCVHERTTRYSRSRDAAESEVINIAPCPACGSSTESLSHFVFDCPATAELRSELFDNLRRVSSAAASHHFENCANV